MNVGLWEERFADHLLLQGRSPRTARAYRYDTRNFLHFLSDRGLTEVHQISRDEVCAYQAFLHRRTKANGEPLAVKTRNTKMAAVLSFLSFLTEAGHLLINPGRDIKLPKTPRRLLPELLDEEQVVRLLETPDTTTPLGLRDRAAMELLYSSALRNTELRMLELADVDLARLWVRVLHGKGDKQRMVPLGEPAAAWVEEYLRRGRGFLLRDGPDPGYLFLTLRGQRLSGESLGKLVKKHAEAAGLKKVTPHLLRHCCASHMLAREARLRYLQELLGHASADTTQRYTQVQLADLRAVHQRCHPRESY